MDLAAKYPSINIIHLIIRLGGWEVLRKRDQLAIKKYFSDKGITGLMEYTAYELKELEKGRKVKTINRWRDARVKKNKEREMKKVSKGKGTKNVVNLLF